MVIPSGGMNTLARLELMRTAKATALFCTPSYALRLAEVARQNRIDPAHLEVRKIVVAGEPGGSSVAIREQIESAFGATLIDHAGATEVGPWGFGDRSGRGLFVIETEFIAEFHSLATGQAAADGELAELVITTLGRSGSPVIRYRTGDIVRPRFAAEFESRLCCSKAAYWGSDDMLIVRGVISFPAPSSKSCGPSPRSSSSASRRSSRAPSTR